MNFSRRKLRYTADELLVIRNRGCACVKRRVVRKLKYFRIYLRHIPVIISQTRSLRRGSSPSQKVSTLARRSALVRVDVVGGRARGRKKRRQQRLPSILLTNVRCIRNKMDEVLQVVSKLSPDVAIFCESWLGDDVPNDAVNISGYSCVRNDRNNHRGGLITYFSDALHVKEIELKDIPELESSKTHFSVFVLPDISLLLVVLYHPVWNNPLKHETALSCLMLIIDFVFTSYLDSCKARIIICGDFNDLRKYNDRIIQMTRLKQVVNFPTRGVSTLDQIFTNIPVTNPLQCFSPIGKSDHSCVFWTHGDRAESFVKKEVRIYSKSNTARFSSIMYDIDWLKYVSSFSDACIDDAFFAFLTALKSVFDLCFPKRCVRLRSTDQPWVKPSLKLLIDDRDRAFFKGRTRKYQRLRMAVINHIRILKRAYLSCFLSKDARSSWNAIRTISRMKCTRSAVADSITADDFNEYFQSIFQSKSFLQPSPSNLPDVTLELSFFEVHHQLSKLQRKCSAPDDVPFWVYCNYSLSLSPAIAFLFNLSLREGHFPSCLKKAYVSPIPKCHKPLSASDFRPISILPLFQKYLKKSLHIIGFFLLFKVK